MELQKKSELSVGRSSFVISTQLEGDEAPSIATKVHGSDGKVVFQTSQDISTLKPIFQNSQKVFARLEAQHLAVIKELQQGRIPESGSADAPRPASQGNPPSSDARESDALAHAVDLLGKRSFEKAASALRAVLETYPNCSEARELLEVAYKASSEARSPVDIVSVLRRGTEAFASSRQREAIEAWKQCLAEEPENRRLQLLVLLATTWSQERRQGYASEVLASGGRASSGGRPEELQALLLVTQTVEGTPSSSPDETILEGAGEPSPPSPTPSVLDETMVQEPDLESLVSDFSGIDELPEPPPAVVAPPAPDPPPKAPLASAPPSPPERVASTSDTQPKLAAPAPTAAPTPSPSVEDSPRSDARPEPRAVPRGPAHRKPAPRRSSGPPLGLIGAGAGALVVVGGVVLWLLSGDSTVPPARLEQAASLASAGQYSQAITAYDSLAVEFGDAAEILLGRGRAKLASGDTSGGLADLERAHALDPESPAIAEEIADVLYSQDNYPAAIGYYEKAFQGGAGSAEGRYRFAVVLVRQQRTEDAVEHLRAAIAKDSAHGEAQFLLGQLLNARGQHQEAEQALRAAERNVEAGSDFLAQLGIALLEQQKLNEAEEIARDFIRSYPSDARARSLLGEVFLSRKQYEPARDQLIQALRTDPREPRAQLALGRTWLAIGRSRNDAQDLGKAQQILTTAQGVDEGKRLLALGQVSLAEGNLPQAQALLQQSLDRGAPALPVHLSLAEAKWKAKDFVGSAEELHRAHGLSPSDPAISLSLAITYFELKDTARAADEFLKAIQGIGMVTPPGEDAGPVVLPQPYIPLPDRFNVNRAIRDSVQAILKQSAEDPTATQLQTLSEKTTFVLGSDG